MADFDATIRAAAVEFERLAEDYASEAQEHSNLESLLFAVAVGGAVIGIEKCKESLHRILDGATLRLDGPGDQVYMRGWNDAMESIINLLERE